MQNQKDYSMQDLQNMMAAIIANHQKADLETAKLKEMFQETDRKIKETNQEMQEANKKMQEANAELRKAIKATNKQIGELTNRLEELVESMIGSQIHLKFDEFGFKFTAATQDYVLYREDNHKIALIEIDFYLQNKDSEMLVEVKTKLTQNDIDEHLRRILIARQYNDNHNNNRKIYGAVAGGVIKDEVKNYAFTNGLFIIEIHGENVKVSSPQITKSW